MQYKITSIIDQPLKSLWTLSCYRSALFDSSYTWSFYHYFDQSHSVITNRMLFNDLKRIKKFIQTDGELWSMPLKCSIKEFMATDGYVLKMATISIRPNKDQLMFMILTQCFRNDTTAVTWKTE